MGYLLFFLFFTIDGKLNIVGNCLLKPHQSIHIRYLNVNWMLSEWWLLCVAYFAFAILGNESRGTAKQYGGELILLYIEVK